MAEEVKEKELQQETPEEAPKATEETAEETVSTEKTAPENEEQEPEQKTQEKKKPFFRSERADKNEKALKEAEGKLQEMTDRLQRNMAEFDNFRKRTEKEKSAMFDMGARNVIEKMLPIVDSFERGLNGLTDEQKEDPFAAGMDKVYKQLLKMLDELEVKPIEAVGQPFDPDKHNAVMHTEDESVGENIIVQEFLKGYTYRGAVVRYSMVQVAN